MAFTEFYAQSSGSNLNAGSTTDDAAIYTSTNGNWNATTGVFTPTAGDPSATVSVGMFASVFLDAATVGVFVGRVTAVDSTTITVSTTAKSGTAPTTDTTGRSVNVGGAWKGPNGAVAFPFGFIDEALRDSAGNRGRVNFKSGTDYDITSAITHALSGVTFQGYTTTPGDGGRAVIDGGTSGASYVLLTLSGSLDILCELVFQNNGASGSAAGLLLSGTRNFVKGCVVNSVRGTGFSVTGTNTVVECEAYGCNQSNGSGNGGFATTEEAYFVRCVSHDNSGSNSAGFVCSNISTEPLVFINCIADTNGGDGFISTGSAGKIGLIGCVAYNNTGDGIDISSMTGTANLLMENCVLASNGGYGVTQTGTTLEVISLTNCAFYSNTSGQTNAINASFIAGSVTLTGDPFTDAANGDFDLNDTAGAGADCRNAGRGNFTQTAASYTGTLSYPDIGASQHEDAGGGGGGITRRLAKVVGA